MTAYEKPNMAMSEIEEVLRNHLGPGAAEITPLDGGNLSSVFSFVHEGKGYVVKFSDLTAHTRRNAMSLTCCRAKASLFRNVWRWGKPAGWST